MKAYSSSLEAGMNIPTSIFFSLIPTFALLLLFWCRNTYTYILYIRMDHPTQDPSQRPFKWLSIQALSSWNATAPTTDRMNKFSSWEYLVLRNSKSNANERQTMRLNGREYSCNKNNEKNAPMKFVSRLLCYYFMSEL